MDVQWYAPFTKSPIDRFRGRSKQTPTISQISKMETIPVKKMETINPPPAVKN